MNFNTVFFWNRELPLFAASVARPLGRTLHRLLPIRVALSTGRFPLGRTWHPRDKHWNSTGLTAVHCPCSLSIGNCTACCIPRSHRRANSFINFPVQVYGHTANVLRSWRVLYQPSSPSRHYAQHYIHQPRQHWIASASCFCCRFTGWSCAFNFSECIVDTPTIRRLSPPPPIC
jgi:hypothetical protein